VDLTERPRDSFRDARPRGRAAVRVWAREYPGRRTDAEQLEVVRPVPVVVGLC